MRWVDRTITSRIMRVPRTANQLVLISLAASISAILIAAHPTSGPHAVQPARKWKCNCKIFNGGIRGNDQYSG